MCMCRRRLRDPGGRTRCADCRGWVHNTVCGGPCRRCRHYLCDNCEMQHVCHQIGEISVDDDEEVNSLEVMLADAPLQCVHIDISDEQLVRPRARLETALYTTIGVLAALQLESYRRSLCGLLCRRRHKPKKKRTVATQSQCTYTSVRGNAQGKFVPTGIASEGAFVE